MSPLRGIPIPRHWAIGATALVILTVGAVAGIVTRTSTTVASHVGLKSSSSSGAITLSPPDRGSPAAEQQSELEQSLNRIRAVQPVQPATSGRYPAVSAEAQQQPDLYAAAFVRELLTQDYRTDREQMLEWVQSESAQCTDPLVVGLVPLDLRGKMAVASVLDGVNGPGPVPSRNDWVDLAARQGYTTVEIQRVIEPEPWTSAVASGQITDPGVTARQVDAQVRLHTIDHGKAGVQRFSVALVLNLEGPPVRNGYGFVAAITYNVAAAS
jgi:hypothetical protein